jgi:hypothetical protein
MRLLGTFVPVKQVNWVPGAQCDGLLGATQVELARCAGLLGATQVEVDEDDVCSRMLTYI